MVGSALRGEDARWCRADINTQVTDLERKLSSVT